MEWIVLQGSAVDESTSIRQRHHAVAEHVPSERLSGNSSCLPIPKRRLVVRVACDVSRARYDYDVSVVQQRHVNRIDWHVVWHRGPAAGALRLAPGGRSG